MKRIYLDYAATTPVDPKVLEFMLPYFYETFGNSQSLHFFGQESSKIVEQTRSFIASMLNCYPEELIFTSGGTESNNTAIKGIYFACKNLPKKHFICSSIEHHAVLEPINFLTSNFNDCYSTFVPVSKEGIVDIKQLFNSITKDTILISVMHANNEIGTIQPIKEIAVKLKEINSQRVKENLPKIVFHTDAVQTFGHMKIDIKELGVDLLSISGHKFYAPKGVGLLYVKKGTKIVPLLHGGGHEFNKRASTVNHSAIAGIYKAAEIAKNILEEENNRIKLLRDKLLSGIMDSIEDVTINGSMKSRLENNLNISIYGIESEALIVALDNEGIAVSSGSACSSGSTEPSHVLLALGQDHVLARGSIRFTLGRFTTEEEIDYVLKILPKMVKKFRKISPIAK